MLHSVLHFLAAQPFMTIFFVLGFGYALGRASFGFFSVGSTAGSLIVALLLGSLAFSVAGVRFEIPDLLGTTFLALFTYAIGLRVGPQFFQGLRQEGVQLIVLVLCTTTAAFLIAWGGARLLGLPPGYSAGILAGSDTISAVLGVATSALDHGVYQPPDGHSVDQIKGNIAAGYSLSYILSVLSIVLLVRNLPGLFGINPVRAAKESEKKYGGSEHPLPGTSEAFDFGMLPSDVRVFELTNDAWVGLTLREASARLGAPILRVTRAGAVLPLGENHPVQLRHGDLLTVGGRIEALLEAERSLGVEVSNAAARSFDIDQAEIVIHRPEFVGKTLEALAHSLPAYGVRIRAVFRGGHELPLLPATTLKKYDVIRTLGPPQGVERLASALGLAVRPTLLTDIITLGFGIGTGWLIGLATVSVAGIPIGLGTMGGVVVAGMVVSTLRSSRPGFGGPMPEPARAFLESIGVDLFVTTLGLTVAPALVNALSDGRATLLVLGLSVVCATLPTFISWLVGLYVLKMDPMVLAGAVAGARNSTTAMRAISDKAKSNIPSFGYPVPYAFSTVVFLIYGYLAMVLS